MGTTWGELKIVAHAQHNLAKIRYTTGRKSMAIESLREAADLYERLGMTQKLAEVKVFLRDLL